MPGLPQFFGTWSGLTVLTAGDFDAFYDTLFAGDLEALISVLELIGLGIGLLLLFGAFGWFSLSIGVYLLFIAAIIKI